MSIRLIVGKYEGDPVALYDSVTGFAFGPTLIDEDDAEAFLEYVEENANHRDPRMIPDGELEALLVEFRKGQPE